MEYEIKVQDLIEHIRFGTQMKYDIKDYVVAIEGLLELYQKEKEKNKELSEKVTQNICNRVEAEVLEEYRLKVQNSISKDKIREKIEELEKQIENINNKNDGYWEDTSIILDEQKQVLEELLEERN